MTSFKNTYQQFLKYLKDQFSNAERYDFEKSIQKDAFEQEAFEGFDVLSSTALEKDMSFLNNQIQNKIAVGAKPKSLRFYKIGIATSLILLLGIGVLFLNTNKTVNTFFDVDKNKLPTTKEVLKDSVETKINLEETENSSQKETQNLNIKKDTISEINKKVISKTDSINTNILNVTSFKKDGESVSKTSVLTSKKAPILNNNKKVESKDLQKTGTVNYTTSKSKESPLLDKNITTKETDTVTDFKEKNAIKVKQKDTIAFSGLDFENNEVLAQTSIKTTLKENVVISDIPTKRRKKGAPPYGLNQKEQTKTYRKKSRKIKKNRVRVFWLKKRARQGKAVKEPATFYLNTKKEIDTTKKKTEPETNDTTASIDDFKTWLDLALNSKLFDPGKLYNIEVSFGINHLGKLDQIRFDTNNDYKIQEELRKVLKSAPNWVTEVFKDIQDRVALELEISF